MPAVNLITAGMDKKFEPAGRMATAIVEMFQEKSDCVPDDLNERGFSSADITNNWHMALSLAEVEMRLNKQAERPTFIPRSE